jgi:hypothetical protein
VWWSKGKQKRDWLQEDDKVESSPGFPETQDVQRCNPRQVLGRLDLLGETEKMKSRRVELLEQDRYLKPYRTAR